MSKWVWVTGLDGKSACINFGYIETIEEPKPPQTGPIKKGAGSRLLWHGGDIESYVKETPEALYAEIHGPPLANLDLLRGAIVVEAHEQELHAPQPRTKAIGDPDLTWGTFADAVVTRLRND